VNIISVVTGFVLVALASKGMVETVQGEQCRVLSPTIPFTLLFLCVSNNQCKFISGIFL